MEMTDLVLVNSRKLSGWALDWAVAHVLDMPVEILPPHYCTGPRIFVVVGCAVKHRVRFRPSDNWEDCGKLISRFMISFLAGADGVVEATAAKMHGTGKDHLEAACRAVVSSFAGEHLLVPAELIGHTFLHEVA